jgi:hypothetical protein
MDYENVVHIHDGVLCSHKIEWNYAFAGKWMDRDHPIKWNKPDWERQISHVLSHMHNLVLNNEWQECKTGFVWGGYQVLGRGKG